MTLSVSGSAYSGCTGHEAGRALLSKMVFARTGQPMPPIYVTPMGKPCFSGGTLHFSITHTGSHVFCALSERNVGIDAEELTRQIPPRLARRILSDSELAQYHAAAEPNMALLTFWVLKEAQAKLTGRGLSYPPNQTHFSLNDPRVKIMDGCVVAVMEEEPYAF